MSLGKSVGWLSVCWTDRRFLPLALCATVVFLLDVVLPLGVASGVLHVAVVLLALRIASGRFVTATAVLCSGLTMLDMVFSPGPGGTEWWKVIVNRGLSILVIWVTAILGQQRNRAAEAERRHLTDLAHLSRVKTAECLAGALAHELNQPLTAIALQAEIVWRQLENQQLEHPDHTNSDPLQPALREIVDQSHRASGILRSLRCLVRRTESTRQAASVSEVIEESLRLIEPTAREAHVELRWRIGPQLPLVCVDRIQIEQVLLNLLQNAIDSLARQQPNDVDSSSQQESPIVEVSAKFDQPGWVRVTVCDNGPGITAENVGTVFEPFATTKTHGLGLGLAIGRSILEAHSGHLCFDRTATKTTFHMDLPTDNFTVA